MCRSICFTVPGKPVPMARARKGKPTKKRPKGRWFTPSATAAYREKVAVCCPMRARASRYAGPVALNVRLLDNEAQVEVTFLDGPSPKHRGDADNVFKNIADALEKAGVYLNDRQITGITIEDWRT